MAETICAVCGKTGGRFRFVGEGKWAHVKSCSHVNVRFEPGKNLWDFSTRNIGNDPNAGPIHVQSLSHLRRLEKEYGVNSVAGNMDSNNW
jgi:hypothetical protein